MNGFNSRLVAQVGVDPARQQRRNAIRIAVEQQVFAVGEVFAGNILHQRASEHAQALAIISPPGWYAYCFLR